MRILKRLLDFIASRMLLITVVCALLVISFYLAMNTANIWVLIDMSACVLVAFFWYSGTLSQTIDELNDTYDQTQMRLTQLQGDQADLKTQLETVGTDAFIENQARTMYGYMMPDEIRFVITNPEALYGEDEIPSR